MVVDGAWRFMSVAAEIIATVVEKAFTNLKHPPCRINFPDLPTPTSWALANHYYPRALNIVHQTEDIFGLRKKTEEELGLSQKGPLDVPDKSFTGPF